MRTWVRLARAVGIGTSAYVLDPLTGEWGSLQVTAPDRGWAAAGESVLTLENPAEADSTLVDAVSGDRLVFDLGDWWAVNILGSLGSDTVLSVARLIPGDEGLAELAVVLIDFHRRVVEWIWQIDQGIGVPVASFPSPDGTRLLVAGQNQDNQVFAYTILSANDGLPMVGPDATDLGRGHSLHSDGSTMSPFSSRLTRAVSSLSTPPAGSPPKQPCPLLSDR